MEHWARKEEAGAECELTSDVWRKRNEEGLRLCRDCRRRVGSAVAVRNRSPAILAKPSTLGATLVVRWRKGRDCAFAVPGRRALRQLSAVQNRSLRFCRTLYLGFKSLRCRQKQKDPREEGLSVFGGRGGRDCAFAIHGRRAFAPAERCPKSFRTILSNPLTSGSRSLPSTKNAKGPHRRAFHIFGGRGGIRTLVGR